MYPLGQMYPNFQQQPDYRPPQVVFQVKVVSSIDEARAFIVNPVYTYLFVDMGTGRIYMKRMGNNGLSDFFVYEVNENPAEPKSPIDELKDRIAELESQIKELRNNESVSDDGRDAKPHGGDAGADAVADENAKPAAVPKGAGDDGGKKR
ncbi:MAG: septum formation initiator family protein [Lachnospiraceae bacterium]|nr:septum formation initiator family protein [Lachnospiraceae bacterium]